MLGRRTQRQLLGVGSQSTQWDGWGIKFPWDRGGAFNGISDLRGSSLATQSLNNGTLALNFDPYGEAHAFDANGQPVATLPENLSNAQWAGMQVDSQSLYYARNRYYNPQIGRFISEDPIGLLGGFNPYAYCEGDPVNFADPTGLQQQQQLTVEPSQYDSYKQVVQQAGPVVTATSARLAAVQAGGMITFGTLTAGSAVWIASGAVAAGDLANYLVTGNAAGPFTMFGKYLGNKLFPMESMDIGDTTPYSGSYKCKPNTLFHYTDEKGFMGMMSSGEFWPSLKAKNPEDARHGDGQYLTNIIPGTKDPVGLSKKFVGNSFMGDRYTHFLEIDVSGLDVVSKKHISVIHSTEALDIRGRVRGSGRLLP